MPSAKPKRVENNSSLIYKSNLNFKFIVLKLQENNFLEHLWGMLYILIVTYTVQWPLIVNNYNAIN